MAEVAAALGTTDNISKLMAQLDRPKLLRMLGVNYERDVVADVEGLHPVTWYQKKTLAIESWKVPYLAESTSGSECCSGAYLSRFGHKTVVLKCFETELGDSESQCAHCEQLWEEASDDIYKLNSGMEDAWQRYEKGERKAMKNWKGMVDLQTYYSEQVQIVKDLLAGSKFEVGAQWPGIGIAQAQRYFLQNAGVLFTDAGRARNPYPRTAQDQRRIVNYTHDMTRLYLRILATVTPEDWASLVQSLQRQAKSVQRAAMWAMQKEFVSDQVFVGPIVAADVMAAGFEAADARFKAMIRAVSDNSEDELDLGEFSWGEGVENFTTWAKTVSLCKRPSVRKKLSSAEDDSGSQSSNVSKKLPWWYGVARGKEVGSFEDWHKKVKTLVIGFSGAIFKKFRSRAVAEAFVQRMRLQSSPAKWFVLKGSQRDGCYSSKLVALSYKGGGELVPMWSIGTAKEFLGKKHVAVYNETVSVGKDKKKFFALAGGSSDGVYSTLHKMLKAKQAGGGVHNVFATRAQAKKFCDDASKATAEEWFVVWEGATTGVMTEDQMLEATCGVESVIEGPMSAKDAQLIWSGKADEIKSTTGTSFSAEAAAPAPAAAPKATKTKASSFTTPVRRKREFTGKITLQSPANEAIEKAWLAGKKRVFSCWVSPTVGRVALSWEEAAEGIVDPEVRVTSSESDLFLNIAKAEKSLKDVRKPSPVKSVAERMAEARKLISKSSASTSKSAVAAVPVASPPATAAPSAGQSGGTRYALFGVVRTKEASKITSCFIDAKDAVMIVHEGEPSETKIFGELPAPGGKTYIQRTIGASADGDLSLNDYVRFKDSTERAWPLKKFGAFMAFCDLGTRLCRQSQKPVAAANAAFFSELGAMAVRVYNNMERRGTLGANEFRFSVRMFMSLQLATNELQLHVNTAATRFLNDNVDEFAAYRIPQSGKHMSATPSRTTPRNVKPSRKRHSGCYLCPSAAHQAWDTKFHPRNPDGSRKKVAEEDKAAILSRIDNSSGTKAEKADEVADVKRYWAQYAL